jgi:release factor glutamine methyltransferase
MTFTDMTFMDTIADSLRAAAHTLLRLSDSPRLDAEILLSRVLGLPRTALIVRGAEPMAAENRHTFDRLIARRAAGVPVAYLTGTREFWSLELEVTPDVLVPRPETEVLVEVALQLLPHDQPRSVLDLGTGSGAIALAIASERPRIRITGVDVCEQALGVARKNARRLGLAQIRWHRGSWFDAVPGERFDMIVANPPYVAADDPALAQLAAEPALALCGGPDGFDALGAIAGGACAHLNANGWLVLEHGSAQGARVAEMLERGGFVDIRSHADYSGNGRVTLGTISHHTRNAHDPLRN